MGRGPGRSRRLLGKCTPWLFRWHFRANGSPISLPCPLVHSLGRREVLFSADGKRVGQIRVFLWTLHCLFHSSSSWGGGACGIAFRQCRLHPFPKGVHGSGARATRRVQEGAPGWLVREEGWGRRASLVSGIVGAGASPCLLPTAARGEPFRSILSVRNRALELTRAGPPEICGGSEPSCLCAGHS